LIYDMLQFAEVVEEVWGKPGVEEDTPIIATAVIDGKEIEYDLLGFEYEADTNIVHLNLGPRR
jgi:hypothetical protein